MHDGMQYSPIQSQGQGHKPLNVGNSANFNGCLLPQLIRAWFSIFVLVFVSRDFEVGSK